MDENRNKRLEERLSYKWPVLFAEDFTKSIHEGVMVDVSSGGLAFLCRADEYCPEPGNQLAMRFSIPLTEEDAPSEMTSFTRTGKVLRIDCVNSSLRRVAIQFNEALTLKPFEQAKIDMMNKCN